MTGVLLRDGRDLLAGAVIVTTGTFLNGLAHVGEQNVQLRPQRRGAVAISWGSTPDAWACTGRG